MSKATEIQNWMAASKPGDKFVYHVGLLMADRQRAPTYETNEAASMAYRLYKLRSVALVQRRVGHERSEYLAVKL